MEKTFSPYYLAYIKSPEWAKRRSKAMRLDGYRCRSCGCRDNLQVHHLTYSNLGRERMRDLATLCGECHDRLHSGGDEFWVIMGRLGEDAIFRYLYDRRVRKPSNKRRTRGK